MAQAGFSSDFAGIHLLCQHHADHFFERAGPGTANAGQHANQNILLVEVLDLQIIKTLCAVLIGKELDMLLDDRLILLFDTQIHRKQRCTVRKEPLGVQQSILQVVIFHVRFRERSINQIIGRRIFPFQKSFRIKLIVRLQTIDRGILQSDVFHILFEFTFIVIPKDELPGISRKLSIQPVYDLFQVKLCHNLLPHFFAMIFFESASTS